VIDVDPTVATTSVGASRFDGCADVDEHALKTATQAPQKMETRISEL
jgi:hypothetical protein